MIFYDYTESPTTPRSLLQTIGTFVILGGIKLSFLAWEERSELADIEIRIRLLKVGFVEFWGTV